MREFDAGAVFKYFEEISLIPRGSGNESGIADYLETFAKTRRLECYRDEINNILIYKDATEGREAEPALMLQGHTDMVCEADGDTSHDFLHDPIRLIYDGDFIKADGTTLGADDGAAVAMMLAVLDSADISHPRLECLFTVDEESGMTGASGFDYAKVSAKRCINLDSETEGEAVISCAGGGDFVITHTPDLMNFSDKAFTITVSGLCGGHSGADIHLGRKNANDIMFSLLAFLYGRHPFGLISVNGGEKHNVITTFSSASITYPDYHTLRGDISDFLSSVRQILTKDDFGLKIRAVKCGYDGRAFCYAGTHKIISCALLSPHGLLDLSDKISGMPDASSNLGSVKTVDGSVVFSYLFRFNTGARYGQYKRLYEECAYLSGAELEISGYYPCWQASGKNALVGLYDALYRELVGKEPDITAIHAGVECGFISSAMGEGAEIISIGPDIYDIHSPRERMSVASCERTFHLLCNMLENC